jgi:integrase
LTKITKASVDGHQPKLRANGTLVETYLWDTELKGFGCKATPAGRKVYLFQYRLGGRAGKTQRVTIGAHGDSLTADQARKKAAALIARIRNGEDPAQAVREKRQKLLTGTFASICELYLGMRGKGNTSWAETKRILQRDAVRELGPKPMDAITKGDIAKLIDNVAQRSPSMARALFAALRPMFRWAFERGIIEHNPILALKAPPAPRKRKRFLSLDEIRAFWLAAEKLGWPFGPLLQLLLLTGQRRDEVAGMRWDEIDFAEAAWCIPGRKTLPSGKERRTKNFEDHSVDLSSEAIAVLKACPREFSEDGYVFTTNGKTQVSGFSKTKRRLDAAMQELFKAELAPWRIHDLRRTAATHMGEQLDADPGVIERILNHLSGAQGGLQGVYQRQQYKAKRKAALLAWGAYIGGLIGNRDGNGAEMLTRLESGNGELLAPQEQ